MDNLLYPFISLKTTSLKLVYTVVYKCVDNHLSCLHLFSTGLVFSLKSANYTVIHRLSTGLLLDPVEDLGYLVIKGSALLH